MSRRTFAPLARATLAAAILTGSVLGVAQAADPAKVRVLHASPDAPAVDVYLDDAKVDALTAVPFGVISDYLDVPAGDHNVKVYATGTTSDPVIDADVSVDAGAAYTIAATDAVATIAAQVIQDQPDPDCDTARVRVVHFSADAPAVDVAAAGSAPADAVVKALAYPDATDYLDLPAGSYDLEVRLAGTTTVALALPDVTVEDCTAYSVFAIGSAASPPVGEQALQAVVAVDGTAEPAASPTEAAPTDAAPTPPPTDTVEAAPSASDDLGIGPWLIVAIGLLTAAIVGRRTRRQATERA